jgi:hypothetical protein
MYVCVYVCNMYVCPRHRVPRRGCRHRAPGLHLVGVANVVRELLVGLLDLGVHSGIARIGLATDAALLLEPGVRKTQTPPPTYIYIISLSLPPKLSRTFTKLM